MNLDILPSHDCSLRDDLLLEHEMPKREEGQIVGLGHMQECIEDNRDLVRTNRGARGLEDQVDNLSRQWVQCQCTNVTCV